MFLENPVETVLSMRNIDFKHHSDPYHSSGNFTRYPLQQLENSLLSAGCVGTCGTCLPKQLFKVLTCHY